MSHLKINSHIGRSFLSSHTPTACYIINKRALSIGQDGQLLIWSVQGKTFTPLFTLLPTANHQASSLISFGIINTINSIFQSYPNYKIVTIHQDNRLRIWNWDDGICTTISPIGLFDTPLKGICSDLGESRICFVWSDNCIYGVDLWKMSIVCRIKPSGCIYKVVKDCKRVVLQDTIKRIQVVDVGEITKDRWNDPIGMLVSQEKLYEEMKGCFRKFDGEDNLKDTEDIVLPKEFILPSQDALSNIKEYIINESSKSQIEELFSNEFKLQYPQLISSLKQETISQSCLLYINNSIPYYFFGTQSGKLFGIPLLMNPDKTKTIIFQSLKLEKQVRFLEYEKNMLICSLSNQKTLIFNLMNMESAIANENKILREEQMIKLEFERFLILDTYLSAPIKYKLQTYQVIKTDITQVQNISSFQLQNKQIVTFSSRDKSIQSFKGFTRDNKLLCVLLFEMYVGIVTNLGIHIYNQCEEYERLISYQNWEWKNFNFPKKLEFKKDYHNHHSYKKQNPSTYLIDYSFRYLHQMLDYSDSKQQLIYQIFGNFNDQKIPNQQFPNFYFRNRSSTLSIGYSNKSENDVSIIRMLRNKQRRRCWQNTSYVIHTDIRKQLDKLSSSQQPLSNSPSSLPFIFPWHLDQLLSSSVKRIIGTSIPTLSTFDSFQGISTTFTIYFSSPFSITSYLTSYKAMCIMDYFITFCTKDNSPNMSEIMYKCVQYFTKKRPQQFQPLSISSLSQLSVSTSGNIVNTGCNLLISSIVGKEINLGKIEDYFVMNLKRLQDSKSKQLASSQVCLILTIGFTYLYSANTVVNQKVDLLINRIINAIEYYDILTQSGQL